MKCHLFLLNEFRPGHLIIVGSALMCAVGSAFERVGWRRGGLPGLTNGSMTAWRCVGFYRGPAFRFFGGGGLARWRIADHKINDLAALLPWNWRLARIDRAA